MKKLKIIIAMIFVIGLIPLSVSYSGSYITAKYAGEFMATGVGARALAMGGASVAIAEDATAGYWNPAGLSKMNYPQVIGMYAERFAKLVNYNYAAFALPTGEKTTLALSITRLAVDDIHYTALLRNDLEIGTKYDGNKINVPYVWKTVNDAEWAFYFSYAKTLSEKFAWGSNIKAVTKQIGDNSAWGLGFDFGALYNILPNLNLGINLQDVTTTLLAWDTGRREAITPTVKTGMAYFFEIHGIKSQFIPAIDMDIRFENRRYSAQWNIGRVSFDSHLGLEYDFNNIVAIRLGSDIGHFSAGIGLTLPRLNIDYAFLSHGALGDTHRISLMLTLRENKFSRKK